MDGTVTEDVVAVFDHDYKLMEDFAVVDSWVVYGPAILCSPLCVAVRWMAARACCAKMHDGTPIVSTWSLLVMEYDASRPVVLNAGAYHVPMLE